MMYYYNSYLTVIEGHEMHGLNAPHVITVAQLFCWPMTPFKLKIW